MAEIPSEVPDPVDDGDDVHHTALDPFQILVTQIGLEIRTFEVKVLKSLVVGKIPSQVLNQIDHKEEYSALDLFTKLQEYRFLSVNNLSLLKEALETANRPDLAKRVEKFKKTATDRLDDAPQSQMNNLPAPNSVLLYLLLRGQRNTIVVQRIDGLKESLCAKLELKPSDVPYVHAERGNQESTFVIFQYPNQDDKIDQLNSAAVNKAEWLVNLGVLKLKIGGKSAINIDDAIQEIKPEPMEGTSYLAMSPDYQGHDGNVIDLILVVEVPFSVTVIVCKYMLEQCQSAIHTIAKGFDMRLAVVTYGNHCETTPSQQTAIISQMFSNDFDIYSRIKNAGQQGGTGGNSGIADALEKVVNLTSNEEVRKKANKLCIFITFVDFLVQDSTDLEYYRCSHGNDAIKLCNTLAKNGIPLYIFGVNALPSQGENKSLEENYFLEGIAAVGGGRYFQLEDVNHLEEALTCVVQHDVSIENQREVTGEIIREEINNNHGVISHNDLPRQLEQQLQLKSCKVDNIKVKSKSLKQVSPIANRVSWADDLDDAKAAVAKMEEKKECLGKPRDDSTSRGAPRVCPFNVHDITGDVKEEVKYQQKLAYSNLPVGQVSDQKCPMNLVEGQGFDLEVAVRVVRRQLHRMKYYKKRDQSHQEPSN